MVSGPQGTNPREGMKSLGSACISGSGRTQKQFQAGCYVAHRRDRHNRNAVPMPTTETARFILEEATALGIHVGTNGDELLMIAPLRIPREVRVQFEAALNE